MSDMIPVAVFFQSSFAWSLFPHRLARCGIDGLQWARLHREALLTHDPGSVLAPRLDVLGSFLGTKSLRLGSTRGRPAISFWFRAAEFCFKPYCQRCSTGGALSFHFCGGQRHMKQHVFPNTISSSVAICCAAISARPSFVSSHIANAVRQAGRYLSIFTEDMPLEPFFCISLSQFTF